MVHTENTWTDTLKKHKPDNFDEILVKAEKKKLRRRPREDANDGEAAEPPRKKSEWFTVHAHLTCTLY